MAFIDSNGRTRSALADINITPLVDVVLVLLIIFMLTAPILQSGIEVDVPKTKTVKEITEERLVISIDKQQRVFLGNLKTGKEADVFLIRRGVPGGRSCLLAAKRYRDPGHRMFHRDSGYLEGRRVRESRVNRAVASRSAFGREAIAGQWANAEFSALARLYAAGIPVPYPAQILDTELLLEFIGSADGTAAPRLAETRPDPPALAGLWDQLVQALTALARDGLAHGDLSAYNLLVHDGRLVMIDLPQVVDVIANPRGAWYLTRDAENIGRWFTARGLSRVRPEPADLPDLLRREALL